MTVKGFTLIEMLVAVTVSMLFIGGLSVSLTKYYDLERVIRTSTEIESLLLMVRNLAVTNQVPAGFTDSLDQVVVTIDSHGLVEAFPYNGVSGIGTSYFSKQTGDDDVNVITTGNLRFASSTGKIVGNTSIGITISLPSIVDSRQIVVTPLGTIK